MPSQTTHITSGMSAQGAYIAIDFETSSYASHSACALGLTRIEQGRIVEHWYGLIRPPQKRIMFTEVHGLVWADLKDAPSFQERVPEILAFCGQPVAFIAHNAAFDKRVLAGCCDMVGVGMPSVPFLCTCRGARKSLGLARNTLSEVCAHLGIALNHHHAGSDAAAAAEVYLNLRERGMTDDQLRV